MDCSNSNSFRISETPGESGAMVGNTRQSVATSDQSDAQTAASAARLMTSPTELMMSVEMGSRKKRPAPQPPTVHPQVVTTRGLDVGGDTMIDLGGHQAAPQLNPQSVPQPAPRVTLQTSSQAEVQIGIHGGEQTVPHPAPRTGHQGTSQVGPDVVPQAAPRAVAHVEHLQGESHTGPQAIARTTSHKYDLNTEDQIKSRPGTVVSRQLSGPATTSHTLKPIPSRPPPPRLHLETGLASDSYDKGIRMDLNPEPKARPRSNIEATPSQSSGSAIPVMDGTNPILDNVIPTNLGRYKRKAPERPAPPQLTRQSVPTSSRPSEIPVSKFGPSEASQYSSSPVTSERMEELTNERSLCAKEVSSELQFTNNNSPILKNDEIVEVSTTSNTTTKMDEPVGVSMNLARDQFAPIAIARTSDAVSVSTERGHFERYNEGSDVCNITDDELVDLDEIAFDETEVIFVNPKPSCLEQGGKGSDIATRGLETEHRQDIQSQNTLQSPQQAFPVQSISTDLIEDSPTSGKNLDMQEAQSDEVFNSHITAEPDLPRQPLEKADISTSSEQARSPNCQTSRNLQTVEDNISELCSEKKDLVSLEVQTDDDVFEICPPSTLPADEIQTTSISENVETLKPEIAPHCNQTVDLHVSHEMPLSKPGLVSAEIQGERSENLWTGANKTNSASPPICLDDDKKTAVSMNTGNEMSKAGGFTLPKYATGELKMDCTPSATQQNTKHELVNNTFENKHIDSSTDVNCNVISAVSSENFDDSNSQQVPQEKHVEYSVNERTSVDLVLHEDVSRETSKDRVSVATGNLDEAKELKSSGEMVQQKRKPPPVPMKSHKGVSKMVVPGGTSASDSSCDTTETIKSETEKAKNENYSGIYQYLLKSLSSSSPTDSPIIQKSFSNEEKITSTDHNASKSPDKMPPPVLSKSFSPTTAHPAVGDSIPTYPRNSSEVSNQSLGNENIETSKKDQPVSSIYQILKKSFPPPTSKRPSPGMNTGQAQKDSLAFHLTKNQDSGVSKDEESSSLLSKKPEQSIARLDASPADAIQNRKLPIFKHQDNLYQMPQTEKPGIPKNVGNLSDISNTKEDSLPPPLPQEPPPPLPQQPPPPLPGSSSPFSYEAGESETPSKAHESVSGRLPDLSPSFRSGRTLNSTPVSVKESSQEKSRTVDSDNTTYETLLASSSPKKYFSLSLTEKADESVTQQGDNSPSSLQSGKKLSPALLPKPYSRPFFGTVDKRKEIEVVEKDPKVIDNTSMTEKTTSPNQELRVTNSLQTLTKEEQSLPKELATAKSNQQNSDIRDRCQLKDSDQKIFPSATEEADYLTGKSKSKNNVYHGSRNEEAECQLNADNGSGMFYQTSVQKAKSGRKEDVNSVTTCKDSGTEAQAHREENRDKATNKTLLGKEVARQKIQTRKREHQPSTEQESAVEEDDQILRKMNKPSLEEELHYDEETGLRHRTSKQSYTEQHDFEEPRSRRVMQPITQVKNAKEGDDHQAVGYSQHLTETDDAQPKARMPRRINDINTIEDDGQEVDHRPGRIYQSLNQDVDEEDQRPRRITQRSPEDENLAKEDHRQKLNNQRSAKKEDVEEEDERSTRINRGFTEAEVTEQEAYQGPRRIDNQIPKQEEDFEEENQIPQNINPNLMQKQQADEIEEKEDLNQRYTEGRLVEQEDYQDQEINNQRRKENDGVQKEGQRSIRINQHSTEEEDVEEEEKSQTQRRINQRLKHEEDVEEDYQVAKRISQQSSEEENVEGYIPGTGDQRQIGISQRLTQEDVEEEEDTLRARRINRCSEDEEDIEEEAQQSKEIHQLLTRKEGPAEEEEEEVDDDDEEEEEAQRPRAINNRLTHEEEEAQRPIRSSQNLKEEEDAEEEEDYQGPKGIDHRLREKEDIEEQEEEEEEDDDDSPKSINKYSKQEQDIDEKEYDRLQRISSTEKEDARAEEKRGGRKEEEDDDDEEEDEEEDQRPRQINQQLKEQSVEGNYDQTPIRIDRHSAEKEGVQQEDYNRKRNIDQFSTEEEDNEQGDQRSRINQHYREEEDVEQEDYQRPRINQSSTKEPDVEEDAEYQRPRRINQRYKEKDDVEQEDNQRPRINQRSREEPDDEEEEDDEDDHKIQKAKSSIKLRDVEGASENRDTPSLPVKNLTSPKKDEKKQQSPKPESNSSIYQIIKKSSGLTESSAIAKDRHTLGEERHSQDVDLNQGTLVYSSQFQNQTKKGRDDAPCVGESSDLPGRLKSSNQSSPTRSSTDQRLPLSDNQPVAKRFQSQPSDTRPIIVTQKETSKKEKLTEAQEDSYGINQSLKHPPATAAKPAKLSPVKTSFEGDDGIEGRALDRAHGRSDSVKSPPESLLRASTKQGTGLSKETKEKKEQKRLSDRDVDLYAMASSKTRVFPALSHRSDSQRTPPAIEEKSPSTAQKRTSQKTSGHEEHDDSQPTKGRFLLKSAEKWRNDDPLFATNRPTTESSGVEQYSFYFSFPETHNEGNSQQQKKPEKQSHSVSDEPSNTNSGANGDNGDQSATRSEKPVKKQLPTSQSLNSEPEKASSDIRHIKSTTKDVPLEQMKDRLRQWHQELQQDRPLRTKRSAVSAVKHRSNAEDCFSSDKPVSSSKSSRDPQRDHGKIQFHIDLEKSKAKRCSSHGVEDKFSEISTASLPRQPPTYFDLEEKRLAKTSSDRFNYVRHERENQPVRYQLPPVAKEDNDFFFTTEEIPKAKARHGSYKQPQETSSFRVASFKSRTNAMPAETPHPKPRTSTMSAETPNPKPRTSTIAAERGSTSVATKPSVVRITSNFRMQSAVDLPYASSVSSQPSNRYSSQTATRGERSTELDARRNSLDRHGRPRTFYE